MTSWAWGGFAERLGMTPGDLDARGPALMTIADIISADRTEATAVTGTCAAYAAHHNGGNAKIILDMINSPRSAE